MPRAYHTDTLERERAAGRISLAAFGAAEIFRRALVEAEREPHIHGGPTGERASKPLRSRDMAQQHVLFVKNQLGPGAELLKIILVGGEDISSVAQKRGKVGIRERKKVGDEFRQACEDLAVVYASAAARALASREDENHAP